MKMNAMQTGTMTIRLNQLRGKGAGILKFRKANYLMKYLLKIEELFMFGLSIYLFTKLDFAWWWYPVFLFSPDLSMLGYLISPQVGA